MLPKDMRRPRLRGVFYVRLELPIYEYICSSCSNRFERRQRFDEEPVSNCPLCEGKARRVIHSVPILFKGSGFYCTDHGRSSMKHTSRRDDGKEIKAEEKAKVTAEAKADTKTEAKPEEGG